MTSSLEKKAAAAAIRNKIEQDSVRVGAAEVEEEDEEESSLSSGCSSSAAYEIAATAASFVQSQTKHLIAIGSEPLLLSEEGNMLLKVADEGNDCVSPRKHKSERAACVAADAMTALVAAGEKEKEKAARDLQSLHSAPCEWFVCDDSDIYTRCFVIQVKPFILKSQEIRVDSNMILSLHQTYCGMCRDRTL